jgi:aminoglycoside phosphotransferase (APT) family kinase protein
VTTSSGPARPGHPRARASARVEDGGGSLPHGFADTPETRRLLRARPPGRALEWVARTLGAPVVSVRAVRGGMSSAVHALTLAAPPGRRGAVVVLRRYVRPELNAEEPGIAEHEARSLDVATAMEVPTPELLALDATGTAAGSPSLVMSRLPGRVDWHPAHLDVWLDRLAELLPPVHAAPVPPPGVLPPYTAYVPDSDAPPRWTAHPKVWERAVEIARRPATAVPSVVVHRDFHPGNVLWRRGAVTGLVDWQSTSVGPASVDVGHCRVNLLRFGLDAAAHFTRRWEHLTGTSYHPWGDIVSIVGFLDGLRSRPGSDGHLAETLLGAAVSELGWP